MNIKINKEVIQKGSIWFTQISLIKFILQKMNIEVYSNSMNNIDSADFIHCCLDMITYNIAQIAYLNALNHNINHIVFAGSFVNDQSIIIAKLTKCIEFWSKKIKTIFFRTLKLY